MINADDKINQLVSIIIPAHQVEAFIRRSIQSALNQTHRNVEVVVVENGSTDKTMSVIESISDDRLVVLHSEKGVSNARNIGLDNATGEYVLFLDADDWLEEDALEKLLEEIDDDIDLISARYYGDNAFESYKRHRYEAGAEEYILKCLYAPTKRGNCTGNLYRLDFLNNNGIRFDSQLSHAEDSVFFTSVLMKNPIVLDIETPIYHVYSNPESATRRHGKDNIDAFCNSIDEVYRLLDSKNNSIKNAGYIFALNQILVIAVNGGGTIWDTIELLKTILKKTPIVIALQNADISKTTGVMRVIFYMIKKRVYLPIAVAVKIRAIINANRTRQTMV